MANIHRQTDTISTTLQTDDTSPILDFENYSGGMIFIPSGSSITALTWFAAPQTLSDPKSPEQAPGTRLAANDSTGVAVTQTVAAAKCYQIPVALFGCPYVQCRANVSGAVFISLKT